MASTYKFKRDRDGLTRVERFDLMLEILLSILPPGVDLSRRELATIIGSNHETIRQIEHGALAKMRASKNGRKYHDPMVNYAKELT